MKVEDSYRPAVLALVLALAGLMAAADATAQLGGGFPGGGMGSGRSRGGASRDQQQQLQQQQRQAPNPETGANMLEQTIEELRVDLKLQPTQVPSWETYVGKARLLAGDISREHLLTTASTQASALKLIDRSVDAARNRLAALEEIADAAKVFYALLTPEQQALADPRLAALVPGRGGAYPSLPPRSSAPPPKAGTGY
jgi:Spy/CpxP family protein refolding chaperone